MGLVPANRLSEIKTQAIGVRGNVFKVMIVLQFGCREASLWSGCVFSHVYPYNLLKINRRGNYYFYVKSKISLER